MLLFVSLTLGTYHFVTNLLDDCFLIIYSDVSREVLRGYLDLVEVDFRSEPLGQIDCSAMSEPGEVGVVLLIVLTVQVDLMELLQVIHGHYQIELGLVASILHKSVHYNAATYLAHFTVPIDVVPHEGILDELIGLRK